MKHFDKVEEKYKKYQTAWKIHIRLETNKYKRFWKWIWFFVAFPWVWLWVNIRDWRTFLIFAVVFLLVSSEVWFPYLIGLVFWNKEALRISMFSVGSSCWLFWAAPGTPFLVICIGITIAIKGLFNKIKSKKELNRYKDKNRKV